jgi:hypothetical protein
MPRRIRQLLGLRHARAITIGDNDFVRADAVLDTPEQHVIGLATTGEEYRRTGEYCSRYHALHCNVLFVKKQH